MVANHQSPALINRTMFTNYVPVIVDGLVDAALIFFVAVGLTLVFSVARVLNVAHGSFYALGAYLSVVIGIWQASAPYCLARS